MSFISAYNVAAMGQRAAQQKKENTKNPESPTPQGKPHIYAIVLSVVALVISALSLWESHQSREISYQTSTAFLDFEVRLRQPLESKRLDFVVIVRNSGRSTARNLTVVPFASQIVEGDAQVVPTYNPHLSEKMMPVFDLEPGTERLMTPHPESNPLTDEEVSNVAKGRETLYIYGMVVYQDLLGNTHTAHFCRYYHATAGGGESKLSICSVYNDTE